MLTDVGLALIAFALAFVIGWERHQSRRPAGLEAPEGEDD